MTVEKTQETLKTAKSPEPRCDSSDSDEMLLKDNPNRFVLFPIKFDSIWEMYKKHVASFWTVEEIDLSHDFNDWSSLNDNERHFISTVLAFFAARFFQVFVLCWVFLFLGFLEKLWFRGKIKNLQQTNLQKIK